MLKIQIKKECSLPIYRKEVSKREILDTYKKDAIK
jgi:hypothetical protein